MKFKLAEKLYHYNDYELDELRELVQEYLYDAIDALGDISLDAYLAWFEESVSEYDNISPEDLKVVVTDAYIEAVDCRKIHKEKTMITSQLKDYIESNSTLLDNVEALINNCPEHLRHELQLALDVAELNESLDEELYPELRQFFGKTKNKTYNDRGTTRLHIKLIDKLGFIAPEGNDYYAIHHVDGEHLKQNTENELLLLQSDHNKIHSDMMKDILNNESFTSDSIRYKLGYIAKVQQINSYIEKLHEYKQAHEELLSGFFDKIEFTPQSIDVDIQKFEDAGKQALFNSAKKFLEHEDAVVIKLPFKHKHKHVVTLLKYFKPGLSDEHLKSIIIE